jgi:hypothetical protein
MRETQVVVLGSRRTYPEFLRVPKSTGTHGDTLVAWGLARLSSQVLGHRVELHDRGGGFEIELRQEGTDLDKDFPIPETAQLWWLSSTQNNRFPPASFLGPRFDRDHLREEADRLREATRAMTTPAGDAPLVTSDAPVDVRLYPLYQVLTNPGTQWAGYNSMVESLQPLMTPSGWRLILDLYAPDGTLSPSEVDKRLKAAGLTSRSARWRNPPGFLYPGLNKGPTMLLRTEAGTLVGNANSDWMMSDRSDRSIIELYLAYLGYFGVAQVLTSREERVVVVPAPYKVQVPRAVGIFRHVELRYSGIYPYMAVMSALQYAEAVAKYLLDLRRAEPEVKLSGQVLTGVHISRYWMPSGNTYAPRYTGSVPMPRWLEAVRKEGIDAVRETVEYHRNRVRQVRGKGEERSLASERRRAIELYQRSLDGGAAEWFHAVTSWYAANREGGDDEALLKSLWRWEEVRRIAVASDHPKINEIIDSEAFRQVAGAIRKSTVLASAARQRRKAGVLVEGDGSAPARSPFSPQYDLVTTLMEAAERHPMDFLQELYAFAARFNDESMRQFGTEHRRALIRQDHLEQITEWVTAEGQRHVVPFALLAFGTSSKGNRPPEPTEEGSPEITGEIDTEGSTASVISTGE